MAKRIEGVTEKLLECAKEEFLANGYENTSLRIIAEKAGYTKGVIYIRYPDKESLYRALVEPVADGLCNYLKMLWKASKLCRAKCRKRMKGRMQTKDFKSFSVYL